MRKQMRRRKADLGKWNLKKNDNHVELETIFHDEERFFVVHPLDNKCNTIHKDNSKGADTERTIDILHQNIRSLKRKYRELQVLLHTDFNNVGMLCCTEHWLNHQQVEAIKIGNFILTSKFCRMNDRGRVLYLCQEGNKNERTK
jgi:hypothetical protein